MRKVSEMFEKVQADDLHPGDVFGYTREREMRLKFVESIGASSRYLHVEVLNGAYAGSETRIRPRHTTKFWRYLEAVPA